MSLLRLAACAKNRKKLQQPPKIRFIVPSSARVFWQAESRTDRRGGRLGAWHDSRPSRAPRGGTRSPRRSLSSVHPLHGLPRETKAHVAEAEPFAVPAAVGHPGVSLCPRTSEHYSRHRFILCMGERAIRRPRLRVRLRIRFQSLPTKRAYKGASDQEPPNTFCCGVIHDMPSPLSAPVSCRDVDRC